MVSAQELWQTLVLDAVAVEYTKALKEGGCGWRTEFMGYIVDFQSTTRNIETLSNITSFKVRDTAHNLVAHVTRTQGLHDAYFDHVVKPTPEFLKKLLQHQTKMLLYA